MLRLIKKTTIKPISIIKIFLLFFLVFYCFQAQSYAVNEDQKIKVSPKTFEIINNYFISSSNYKKNFKHNFRSKSLNRMISQHEIMNISLSETGNMVVLSFCNDDFSGCAQDYLAKFQTLKKCERLSQEKCKNIIEGKKIILKNKKLFLNMNENLEKYFIISDKQKLSSAVNHYEIQYPSNNEFADNDYDN